MKLIQNFRVIWSNISSFEFLSLYKSSNSQKMKISKLLFDSKWYKAELFKNWKSHVDPSKTLFVSLINPGSLRDAIFMFLFDKNLHRFQKVRFHSLKQHSRRGKGQKSCEAFKGKFKLDSLFWSLTLRYQTWFWVPG